YWPIIQAFVPGKGKGVFTVCDHGRPIAWFAHERLRDVRPSGSGSSLRRSVALDPRLQTRAERLLAQMEWHGPAMAEFRDEGTGAPGHQARGLGPPGSLARRWRVGGGSARGIHQGAAIALTADDSVIRVLMITSVWPTPGQPRTSYFIRRQAEFLQAAGVDVDVFH